MLSAAVSDISPGHGYPDWLSWGWKIPFTILAGVTSWKLWLFCVQIQKALALIIYFFKKAVMKLCESRCCHLLPICRHSFCTIACIKTWVSFKIVEIKQVLSILWVVLRVLLFSDSGGGTLKQYKGSSVLQQVQLIRKKSTFRYYQLPAGNWWTRAAAYSVCAGVAPCWILSCDLFPLKSASF